MNNKKTALITGASSGIGKELAGIHAAKGGDIILVARRGDKLEDIKSDLQKSYGTDITIISKDLSVVGAAQELYDEVQARGLKVDYLMNNAGFGLLGKFYELPLQRQVEMINLNMTALTELTHLFLPEMLKQNSGKILNTSSTASLMPGPLQAVYYATKAYVTFFSNALAQELHDTDITVTNLMPGATESEFGAASGMDKTPLFKKPVSAKSVAQDGYDAMMRGDLDVISGLTFGQKIMLAMIPFTPKNILLKSIRKMQEV